MKHVRWASLILCAILAGSILCGCATIRHPLPMDLVGKASVDCMSDVRTIVGIPNPDFQKSVMRALLKDEPGDYRSDSNGHKVYPMLAISGGAADGAYGAGLLKGWSEEGSRPNFKIVTGVSTGAIAAPMAFLGKEYDGMIEELYTTISTRDVMGAKNPLMVLFGDSLDTSRPLKKLIEKYLTKEMLEKVAVEHNRGRRLFIGTSYLDAQRFAIWDMGVIAVKGNLKLFREVMLASAAIPIIFPPVYIHVVAGGKSYDEMHVDGGAITQMFTMYKLLEASDAVAKEVGIDPLKIRGDYYIIRNGYMDPAYKAVKDNLPSIARRTFDTMINYQGIDDAYRIYALVRKGGDSYNLAFIPGDFRPSKKEDFDPRNMRALFNRGYEDAVKGYKWHKEPPDFGGH
ncbi:MAG: patatin-like phospholipase family protein [Candidatus Omnitrophica bacterium]|nr:patatin-like phospholipase family protein [Candidatus Omnitrophota bacterium]